MNYPPLEHLRLALARLSRKFIEKLRYTAERPKVAESYSPLVAAPSRAHAPRGVEVPVYIFVCARTAHAVKKKARCGHSAVASASRVGQLVASPMAAVMVAIMDVVLVLFDGHLSSVSGSCGQRSVERTVDWTVGLCIVVCVVPSETFAKFLRKLRLCCAKERKESCANM